MKTASYQISHIQMQVQLFSSFHQLYSQELSYICILKFDNELLICNQTGAE